MNQIHKAFIASMAALSAATVLEAAAQREYLITAPGGVGDVVALTNALTRLKNEITEDRYRTNISISLEPGVYDLSGIHMDASSHLVVPPFNSGIIFGLGDAPGKTVLKGAGQSESRRVLNMGTYNYGRSIVSNLTITGGYTTSDGGGAAAGKGNVDYMVCVISNNFAAGSQNGGGGGIMRGRAFDCLFADNQTGTGNTRHGGGMWTDGTCGLNARTQGVWRCTFTHNISLGYGGGLYLKGVCEGCVFRENKSVTGAAIYFHSAEYGSAIRDCKFFGNDNNAWRAGTALYCKGFRASVFDSVFGGNKMSNGGDGVICSADLTRCSVTNNTNAGYILNGCNLDHCLVGWNTNTYNASAIDYGVEPAETNVNCLFVGNGTYYGPMSAGKKIVNCTYVGNRCSSGANFGRVIKENCVVWNTLLQDNWVSSTRQLDVRSTFQGSTAAALNMTNCCFQSSDAGTAYSGMKDCICATVKFRTADVPGWDKDVRALAYDIGASSTGPANKGFEEPWLMSLVGETDFLGRPRVMLGGLDIGAYECQSMPGLLLLFR